MQFSHPELFFFLLLVPLVLVAAILTAQSRGRTWKKLVGSRLSHLLVKPAPRGRRWASFALGLVAFVLLIAATTIPHAGYREEAEVIRGRNVLIAIDVSRSMLARDASPDRLTAARTVALDLLETFPNDRVGLIAFSGGPWLQAPLTIDHRALTETLQQLDAETLPRGGSDLSQAVKLAIDTFDKTGQSDNALIILSDGEAHDGDSERAADLADEAGVRIFTVGFGSKEGAFIEDPERPGERLRDRQGNLVFTQLKTDQLRLLATRTGGFYMAGNGKYLADNLQKAVETMDQFEAEGGQKRTPIHRYQWFLFPALVFLVASLLSNTAWQLLGRTAAALLILGLLIPGVEARILPATEGEKALQAGEYEQSRDLFSREAEEATGERRARLKLGEGAAAYHSGAFREAIKSYSEALLSGDPGVQTEASFALGNSIYNHALQQLKGSESGPSPEKLEQTITQLTDALGHYDHTLNLAENHAQAGENRAHVEKVIEMLEQMKNQQQQQQQQQSQSDDQEDQGEDQQQDNQDQNSEGNQGQEGDENQPPENENPSEGESEGDQQQPGDPDEPEPGDNEGEQGQQPDQANNQAPQQQRPQPQPLDTSEYGDVSPEELARRILADNADFQTTPIAQRRLKQPRTDKDW